MANGWQTLGAVLGGGSDMKQRSYQTGVISGARQADLLEQAVARRNKNLAMEAITPEAVGASDPQGQNSMLATLLHAGIDPRQYSGYQKDNQGMGFRDSAMAEALKPNADQNMLNRELAVINGKPVTLSAIQGNVSLNPQVTPDQNAFAPTDIGQALIGADHARANASNAQAGASNARARLTDTQTAAGGWNPKSGAAGKPTKPTIPPSSDLAAVLGVAANAPGELPRVPPEKVQQFLTWQAQKAAADSRYNDGQFALRQYAAEKPLGSGIGDAPENVAGVTSMADLLSGGVPAVPESSDPSHPSIPSSAGAASKLGKKTPTVGTTEDGYMFKGGDPADPANWKKL